MLVLKLFVLVPVQHLLAVALQVHLELGLVQ
jgi:hypothetical protein